MTITRLAPGSSCLPGQASSWNGLAVPCDLPQEHADLDNELLAGILQEGSAAVFHVQVDMAPPVEPRLIAPALSCPQQQRLNSGRASGAPSAEAHSRCKLHVQCTPSSACSSVICALPGTKTKNSVQFPSCKTSIAHYSVASQHSSRSLSGCECCQKPVSFSAKAAPEVCFTRPICHLPLAQRPRFASQCTGFSARTDPFQVQQPAVRSLAFTLQAGHGRAPGRLHPSPMSLVLGSLCNCT